MAELSAGFDLALDAPAKLNLRLEVLGPAQGGYHPIDTDMVPVSLCDTVRLRRLGDGEIRVGGGPFPFPQEANLAWRAATALRRRLGDVPGAHIEISKAIPAGAGLGGGSSDAATTLRGLLRLWGRRLDNGELARLALGLGTDVPFFLHGRPMRARGVGEALEPLECGRERFAIAVPDWRADTAEVYRRHDDLLKSGVPSALGDLARRVGRNDLTAATADLAPPESGFVGLIGWMLDRFGNACMTGSGSAVFSRVGDGPLPDPPGKAVLLEAETVTGDAGAGRLVGE